MNPSILHRKALFHLTWSNKKHHSTYRMANLLGTLYGITSDKSPFSVASFAKVCDLMAYSSCRKKIHDSNDDYGMVLCFPFDTI